MRCQNCNRRPKGSLKTGDARPKKLCKVDIADKHNYPSIMAEPEDEVSNTRNVAALKDQMTKMKLNHEVIRGLMRNTFYCRRMAILDDPEPKSVRGIVEDYPLLKKAVFVSVQDVCFTA